MLQIKVWTLLTRKTVVRPLHASSLCNCKIYDKFRSPEGARIIVNGFEAAGITQSVVDSRSENVDNLNALSFID